MNPPTAVLVSAAALLAAACAGSSPSAPSSGDSAARGQAVSAVDGGAISGIFVKVGDKNWVTPDARGYFPTEMQPGDEDSVFARGDTIVERHTRLNLRAGDAPKITLIPA